MTSPVTASAARNRVLRRLLALMRLLSGGRYTAGELAQVLQMHRRTIYRDIRAMQEEGWPVERVVGEDGVARYHRRVGAA